MVGVFDCKVIPGLALTVSYKYTYKGIINKPQYCCHFKQLSVMTKTANTKVMINSRIYKGEKTVFAIEIKFPAAYTYSDITGMMSRIVEVMGSEKHIKMYVDDSHIREVRQMESLYQVRPDVRDLICMLSS